MVVFGCSMFVFVFFNNLCTSKQVKKLILSFSLRNYNFSFDWVSKYSDGK